VKALCWWFSDGARLRYGDPRRPAVGATHEHDGDCKLCERGLHASRRALDAIKYAPGCDAWLVWVDVCDEDGNKVVGTRRMYVGHVSARDVLVEFARWCAARAKRHAYAAAAAYADAYAAAYDADAAAYAAAYADAAAYAAYAAAAYADAAAAAAERDAQNAELTRRLLEAMEQEYAP
jgi:hypothetical protein